MRRVCLSLIVLTLAAGAARLSAQAGATGGEWPTYGGDLGQHALRAARSDQRGQFRQARGRLAVQDRRPRPASRVQLRVHAADGRRRALHDRRLAPRGGRARRRDRRDDVDAQRARGQARRRGAAQAVRPRPRLLDRRPRRSASSTSRPATSSSRSTRRPACSVRRSARTASSI